MPSQDDPITIRAVQDRNLRDRGRDGADHLPHDPYSGVLKDNMDNATAFCDADGKLVGRSGAISGTSC